MIDCDKTKDVMSDYIDDDIESDMKIEVEKHLAKCPVCLAVFDKTRQLLNYMKDLGTHNVSSNFDQSLQSSLKDIRRSSGCRSNSFFKGAAVGAAAAGILFVTLNTNGSVNTDKDNFSNSAIGSQMNPTAAVLDTTTADSLNTSKDVKNQVDKNLKMVTDRK